MTAKCHLIIDTCCDLPAEFIQKPDVTVMHFGYILDGKEYMDDFFTSITPYEFYDAMRNGATPSTSQVPPITIEKIFREAIESGQPTVYLGFSSGISSNFSSCETIKDRLDQEYLDNKLQIIDLKIGCTPEGLLVEEALRLQDSGFTADQMIEWADTARFHVQTLFMVDNLEALHRGGRVPKSVAAVGTALDVAPLLNFDINGGLGLVGAAHGRKKGIKQLLRFYEKNHEENSHRVCIGNADCPEDAERLRDLILKSDPKATVIIHSVGVTIGAHVGPGMMSLSCWGADRREKAGIADRLARKVKGDE